LEIQQSKELKAQVASLTSQVGSLTADVESLTNEVETLKSDKSVLQKEVQRSSHECRINQGWWHENKVLYWAYNLYPLAALLLLALLLWGSNPINKNTMSLSSVIPL
jgi:FtsZ-binding cell division protein ZapB